jgi:hypothetical protein
MAAAVLVSFMLLDEEEVIASLEVTVVVVSMVDLVPYRKYPPAATASRTTTVIPKIALETARRSECEKGIESSGGGNSIYRYFNIFADSFKILL